jgi:uncharacterized membrane protein YgcG
MRLFCRILAVAVFAASASLFAAGSAAATALPIGQCSTSSGVILAVDLSHWGGPVLRSCGSTPTTGYALLHQGGWSTVGTASDGPDFICRIGYSGYHNGTMYPTPATEACHVTPPATKYWSYWHANAGDSSWIYSKARASNYQPEPGSVDAWVYGAAGGSGSGGPSFTPDSVRAHNSSPSGGIGSAPKPAPAPSSSGPARAPGGGSNPPAAGSNAAGSNATGADSADSGTGNAGGNGGSGGSGGSGQASGTPGAAGNKPRRSSTIKAGSTAGSTSRVADPARSNPTASVVNADPAPASKHHAGSAVPELIGGGIVVALLALTGFSGWLRKRAS